MDVSQLCSSIPDHSPKNSNDTFNEDKDEYTTLAEVVSHPESFISLNVALDQSKKLCKGILQFQLEYQQMTDKERVCIIDKLSNSAKAIYKAIESNAEHYIDKKEQVIDQQIDEEDEEFNIKTPNKDCAEYELIRQARNLQNNQPSPKYRKRIRRSLNGQRCHSCNTTETPEWRRGPDGARTLCNACGLHYSKLLKKGSIGVQTHNYLIEKATKDLSSSSNHDTLICKSNPNINYPFKLMNSKYNTSSSFTYTPAPQLPPLNVAVNTNSSSLSQLSPLSMNIVPSTLKLNNNVDQLQIHQWRQSDS
ncbi:GATA zinc finger-domain-containing protein [Cokeromyces recurvatus]|uniref:GATA zinc finger-domain-containing protein n=1 Tax=Cokeromyces recurvatus TaxID=90255 RepID=UPI00221F9F25|nr:GATA zinc finger-domain-containing protein [Cokeromyces recurvatus]KAI7898221.1 GATA zinc finger-domain-containing protein [Cokeromyces recurvatus]